MSMKLPAMFDQNPPDTFDKIVKKLITTETLSKPMTFDQQKVPPTKQGLPVQGL